MRNRSIARFLATALAVFVVLRLVWPLVARPYAWLFRATADMAWNVVLDIDLVFEANRRPDLGGGDTAVLTSNTGCDGWVWLCDSLSYGYVPTVLFLALWTATPLQAARRWSALRWGLLLVQVYVFCRLGVLLLWGLTTHLPICTASDTYAAFLRSSLWADSMSTVFRSVRLSTLEPLSVVLIWLLVSYRKQEVAGALHLSVGREVDVP